MFPESELPSPSRSTLVNTEKRWLLFVYVPVFTCAGLTLALIFEGHKGLERLFDLVLTLGWNVCAFMWCRLDSSERKYPLSRLFSYAVVIFGTLALIYYLFRSRGFVDGLRSVGWLVLYVALLMITTAALSIGIVLLLALAGVISPEALQVSQSVHLSVFVVLC